MANDYYTKTGNPQANSAGTSSLIRAEFTSIEAMADKLPPLSGNNDEVVVVNGTGTGLTSTPSSTLLPAVIHAATDKATPVDADEIPLADSAATYGLKKLTWANLKATLATWLTTLTATWSNKTLTSPVINGGAINNATVGATTPSTGAFTTLSAASPTAAAAGSFSNTSANSYGTIKLIGTSRGGEIDSYNGATFLGSYYCDTANTHHWAGTGADYATLSSTGLAVTGALSATGSITSGDGTSNASLLLNALGAGGNQITWSKSGVSRYAIGRNVGTGGADDLSIYDYTLGSTIAQFTGGNLGLGVPPSAWSGIGKTLQVNTGASISADAANMYQANNAYYNGSNWIYTTSNYATRYTAGTGTHTWYTAPSGTAGNAITFTQAMTLDASGNLMVKKTSLANAGRGAYVRADNGNGATFCATGDGSINFYGLLVNEESVGAVRFSAAGNGQIFSYILMGGATTLSVDASGNIIRTPSDAKLKTNIRPLEYGLSEVRRLTFVRHRWTEEANMGDGDTVGVIADNAELVMPELVSQGGTYKSFDYAKLSVPLGRSVQQLADLVDEQQAQIESLLADKATLLQVLASVDDRLSALEAK